MNLDWQNIAALLMAAVAASYLIWQGKRALSRQNKPGCGNCENCPAPPADAGPALVPLQGLTAPEPHSPSRDQ